MQSHSRMEIIGVQPQRIDFPSQVPMNHPFAPQFERGLGYQPPELREAYADTRIVVAGAGGAGQLLAVMAAKKGCLDIVVADPDHVAPSNNRLVFNGPEYIGRNKAVVTAEEVLAANAMTRVRVYPEGITSENVEDVLMGGLKKHQRLVVFDGIDVSRPDAAWDLAKACRESFVWAQSLKTPYDIGATMTTTLDISEGGTVTTYKPNALRKTYERLNGIKKGMSPHELLEQGMDLTHASYLPKTGSLKTLLAVKNGAPMPTTEESVLAATALGISELNRCVLYVRRRNGGTAVKYPKPTFAPRERYFDARTMSCGTTWTPRLSHRRHLVHAIIRDLFGLNHTTNYSLDEIKEREEFRDAFAQNNPTS